jgi:hypothetical protein
MSLRDAIVKKIEYDKEIYDKYSYSRDYRRKKLLRFYEEYARIYIASHAMYNEDVDSTVFASVQHGAQYRGLPHELLTLIECILEYQTVHLNLYYPSFLGDLCFEQNIFFLQTITMPEFAPEVFSRVQFLIPICYVRRFGKKPEDNRIQAMFYWCSGETNYSEAFFIENIKLENIKDKKAHAAAVRSYVLEFQDNAYEDQNPIEHQRKLKSFVECFEQITLGGS